MGTRELRGNNSDAGHWLHLGVNPRDWRTHARNEAKAPAFASVQEPNMNAIERTKSLWMSVPVGPDTSVLSADLQCDTVV